MRPAELGVVGEAAPTLPVRIGFATAGARDSQHATRLVLAEIIGERMRFLRERLGVSTGASAELVAFPDAGGYVVSAEIDSRRVPEALAAMRADLAALRGGGLTAEQFVRARIRVMRRLTDDPTSTAELAARLEEAALLEPPLVPGDELARRVGAVVFADVQRLVATELAADHEIVAVGGPKATIEAAFAAR
jgi:predicted Zn-dependent peptidase